MKYLSYFENQDQAMSYDGQLGAPHVAYVEGGEQLLFAPYTEGVEEVKFKFENGQLTLQGEVDPAPGFVDLGLSVMWAECNLGASSPEELGNTYEYISGTSSNGYDTGIKLDYDPVYQTCGPALREQYTPRVPTINQYIELWSLPHVKEILNDIEGYRFTGTNGNSIFIPTSKYWTPVIYYYSSAANTLYATTWHPYNGLDENNQPIDTYLPYRGVCSNPPQSGKYLSMYTSSDIETDVLYYTPVRQFSNAVEFTADTDSSLVVYFSKSPDFQCDKSDQNVLGVYPFSRDSNKSVLQLSGKDLADLTNNAEGDYIYVRFQAAEATTITPELWDIPDTVDYTRLLSEYTSVKTTTSAANYRLKYSDWKHSGIQINWTGYAGKLTIYICDAGTFSTASLVEKITMSARSTHVVDLTAIESWATRVIDPDGYLYIQVKAQATTGYMRLSHPTTEE